MAEQQLPDINDYINELPVDAAKQDKLYYAFYSDNPRKALESIQDVPKEIRQALFSIRGKIHKGEQYDLNDIVNSAKATKTPAVETAKGLGERELKPEELSKEAAQLRKEAAQRRAMEEAATVPKPSEPKKTSATPFEKKKEEELDFFGRPKEKPGPRLVPSLPRLGPSEAIQNVQSKKIAKPGPYITKLSPSEEQEFIQWAEKNNVPFDLSADADYDMPGFWKALKAKDPRATTEQKPDGLHFPDIWKTPAHETFSSESIYAGPDAPKWKGSKLYDSTGKLIKDESELAKPDKEAEKKTAPPPTVKPVVEKKESIIPGTELTGLPGVPLPSLPGERETRRRIKEEGFFFKSKPKPTEAPRAERKTTVEPTKNKPVEAQKKDTTKTEAIGIPQISTAKPPVEEVYAPSLAKDLFNATVRGIVPGFFNIPRILSRVPGGFREDIEALRTVPSDIQRNEGFIGQEARAKEDALNRKKTAQLIARAEEKVLPEAPVSGVAKFTESTASTAPYIVAGAVGGPYATRAMGAAAGAEEALTRADISGKSLTESQRAAIGTAGAGIGLTEAIPLDNIIGRLVGAGVAKKTLTDADIVKLLFPKLKDYAKSGAIQFGAEGLQEGFSGLAQDALESMYGGRSTDEIGKDVFEQFTTGGGAGLVVDILSHLAGTRIGKNRLKRMGIDPQAYKEWVESGEADKAKSEAEEIARKAIAPEEAPVDQPEPPPVVDTPAPAAPTATPATTEQPAPVTTETEIEPVEAPPVIAEPPATATAPPPVVTATAEPPAVEAKPTEGVTTAEVKDLSLVNPFTGIESTIQVPSSIAAKYETLTGPQKEAAAGNILSFTSTSPESIENEIQSIKTDLEEVEKNPEAITGLDPYFTSVEDFKSFTNEIVIPYLEYLKASSPSPEPATAGPVSATPPPPGLVQQPAPSGETSPAATSVGTKEISVTKTDGTTEKVEIPSALAQKYESLDDNAKGYASETILEAKGLSSSEINQLIRQITVSVEELEANPDPNIFGGDIGQLKSFVNGLIIPFLQYEKTLKTSQEQPLTTAPPPVATPTTPEPPTAPVLAAQPAPTTQAAQVAHPKLNDQGQPVIINSPSTPTPDATWTDPATTAVFIPEGSTPTKIGNTELKPWSPPQDGWSNISGVNERLDNRKPFTPIPGKQAASGVIIVEDDGRVWLISPTNQFGGYDNTLPKGKLDPSLSMQENAIKEAWEETGLKVDIIGIVGDYEKSTSKVRYYLAKRVGGTPKNMGWESQAVKLATLDDAKNLLNQQVDKDIISDLEQMVSSGKLAEIKDGTPRKLSTYGQEVSAKIGGSNPGGWYQDGGTKWLVKGNKQKTIGSVTPEQSDARASNEVLASKLIQAVDKTGAPDMKLVDLEGKYGGGLGVASKNVPSFKDFDVSNPDHVKAAIKNFATNAWLANYDVLGMGYDNIVITPSGNAMNIDPGGALLFRAQGLPKGASHGVVNGLLDPSAPEFESMQKTTPEQKAVFGKMTPEQLKESAEQLAKITDEKIVKLVNTYGWGSDADKAALADNLIQRKNAILQKAGVTTTSSVAPVAQPSPQVTPQPPSPAVATQTQQPPVAATAKLQLGDPTFGMELDASPATVAEYESLSDSDKDNAYNLISGYIGYFEDPTYILNQYPNILSFVQASINTTSNAQVPYSKAVKLYLEDVANQLAGKTDSEQIETVKQIADQSSGWITEPQQTAPPPSPAVATQVPPQLQAGKLQLAGSGFTAEIDAPDNVISSYNSLPSNIPKKNAADLMKAVIEDIANKPAIFWAIGFEPYAYIKHTGDSFSAPHNSGSEVTASLYLKHVESELNGKTVQEQMAIIKDIADKFSPTSTQAPQTATSVTPYSPPSWSTPSLPSSAVPAVAYQPWKDDAPQAVLDKWNSATPDQQAEASIGIYNIVKPVAEIMASGGSPEEVLQFTIDSYENDPWSQQGVKDIIVPYLKYLKSEIIGKSSNEALDYINKVGEDWGLANNWIESVPGYQSYVASQSGQTAPPPSPAVATQAPPSLTQQAAPAAVQPPQLAAAQPAQQVPQVKIKYKGGSIDAPQNVAAKFSTLNSYWKKKVAQYVSDAATALGGFASQNSSPTEVINYLDNMISIFQSAASSPTSVVAQTANSSVLVPLFEDIKSKFSATTSLITPGSPAAADVSLIYLPFKGLLDNFATPAVTPQQSSQPNTVVSQTAQAPPAGTDQVSTSYGDFVIPSNFVTIFNSMTPGNKESFGKHILEPLFSSITSGASASDIHAKVQSKLTEAQGKLSGYQQKIANGTAVQTEKDRADYYQNLVIPYLNFVSSTGQVPSQPPPTYTSPSGATLSLTPGTLPPKPTWATQLFAQSILSQSPNIISNLANQLSYYGFVNAIKGEANSETQAELNKAQSLVSQSSVDASLIEKAKADGLAKYATIALSYKDVPAKWTRRLFEYIDKPDKFKFAFNPSSSGMTSAQASKSDNQLKNSFDVYQKNEMQSKLTQTQLQHLKDYAGSGYTGLNGSVATAYKSGTPLPNDIAKMVNGDAGSPGLDDAMEKITLGHDMILKRAVSSVNFWSQFGFTSSNQPLDPATMKAMVGQTYTEISYAGTSTDPSWERTIASSPKGKVIFTISANKDVHGIKIYGSPIYGSEGPGAENEVLLHRGTTYIIKSFKFRGYEGGKPIWEAEMMVVDQSPKPLP